MKLIIIHRVDGSILYITVGTPPPPLPLELRKPNFVMRWLGRRPDEVVAVIAGTTIHTNFIGQTVDV